MRIILSPFYPGQQDFVQYDTQAFAVEFKAKLRG